jgi:hypothetical protein
VGFSDCRVFVFDEAPITHCPVLKQCDLAKLSVGDLTGLAYSPMQVMVVMLMVVMMLTTLTMLMMVALTTASRPTPPILTSSRRTPTTALTTVDPPKLFSGERPRAIHRER